jgi:hypothetical protein
MRRIMPATLAALAVAIAGCGSQQNRAAAEARPGLEKAVDGLEGHRDGCPPGEVRGLLAPTHPGKCGPKRSPSELNHLIAEMREEIARLCPNSDAVEVGPNSISCSKRKHSQ